MGLRDVEATLPPGFRFCPKDEELVCHYLYQKINNGRLSRGTLVEVDLHACEPWQLPDVAKLGANEWYFFSFRERKYSTGFRTNRATTSGYWKATGKDKPVFDLNNPTVIVGMRKTLVFYRDRAPNGIKTDWIMHEFRLENQYMPPKDWVLCRVFHKSKGDQFTSQIGLENDDNIAHCVSSSKFACSTSIDHINEHQTVPTITGYQDQQLPTTSFSEVPHFQYQNCHNNLLKSIAAVLNPNPIHDDDLIITDQDANNISNSSTSIVADHDYGFLYDKLFEDNNLGVF